MNVRLATILLVLTVLSVGASLELGGRGSAEAAKAPTTCGFLLVDSFANNSLGWTLGPEWEVGPASESSGHEIGYPDPAIDHTSDSDNGVAGVVIGGNATTSPHPYWYLTSPVINASANMDLVGLHFWRWLNSDSAPNMMNSVEVYNGANWVTLWRSDSTTEDQWTEQAFNLTQWRSAQQLRFRIGVSVGSAGAHVVSSWNIDDVEVTECHQITPPPPPPPPPAPPPPPPPPHCGGPIEIQIDAADPYPSTCSISGLSGTITDVNLVLNGLVHSWPDDIDMLLVGPQGQDALVMSDVGGRDSDMNVVDLTLDDQAAIVLPDSDPPRPVPINRPTTSPAIRSRTRRLRPTGNVSLGTFNGANPNGAWSLYVVDDTLGDVGSIDGWDLQITTAGGSPPPPPPPPPPTAATARAAAAAASSSAAAPPPPPPPAPIKCRVPKVIGLRLAAARGRISTRHCRLGTVRRARSRRAGRVISQRPSGGVLRPRGYKISLVIGRR